MTENDYSNARSHWIQRTLGISMIQWITHPRKCYFNVKIFRYSADRVVRLLFSSMLFPTARFLGGSFANGWRALRTNDGSTFTRTTCHLNECEQKQDEKIDFWSELPGDSNCWFIFLERTGSWGRLWVRWVPHKHSRKIMTNFGSCSG